MHASFQHRAGTQHPVWCEQSVLPFGSTAPQNRPCLVLGHRGNQPIDRPTNLPITPPRRPLCAWRDIAAAVGLEVPAQQLVDESEPLLATRWVPEGWTEPC